MLDYIFNPLYNKTPIGAVLNNSNVTYTLKIAKHINSTAVFLSIVKDDTNEIEKIKMDLVPNLECIDNSKQWDKNNLNCVNSMQCQTKCNSQKLCNCKQYNSMSCHVEQYNQMQCHSEQSENSSKVKEENYLTYSVTTTFKEAGLYWYYFEVYQNTHKFFLQFSPNFEVSPTGDIPQKFQQLVIEKISKVSKNFNTGVMYHIFVDRFCKKGSVQVRPNLILREDWGGEITKNSTDFKIINKEHFGGNLKGIISKLEYLKSLNVKSLYLSPIFESSSYHKYDTADYMKIDSMFGSEADLKNLILKAKEKGIEIILDGVFNHVGDDSIYFNKYNNYPSVGAYQSINSPYFNWFSFEKFPDKYASWWGIDLLPQIKNNSPEFTKFLTQKEGVLQKYMKMGLLGFRLDVVDEIENNKLTEICSTIKKARNDAIIIGEVWEDASNKIAYSKRRNYFLGNQLNSVMNYPLKDAIINYLATKNCNNLKNTLSMLLDHYPKNVLDNLMNILGTHDTSRIMSVLKDFITDADISKQLEEDNKIKTTTKLFKDSRKLTKQFENDTYIELNVNNENQLNENNIDPAKAYEEAKNQLALKLLKIASLIQFTVSGIPCIFYGDEQGLEGIGAPYCRVCFMGENFNKKIKNWYSFLGNLKKEEVFVDGELYFLTCENEFFSFKRTKKNKEILIFTNLSNSPKQIFLNDILSNHSVKLAKELRKTKLSTTKIAPIYKNYETQKPVKDQIIIAPLSYLILKN